MASSVSWAQPWELSTAGKGGTGMLGVKSREEKAAAPAPSHLLYCRLPNFGVQDGEGLPPALLR